MKQTVLYLGASLIGLTIVGTIAGKLTIEQFSYIGATLTSILYGLYVKLNTSEKIEQLEGEVLSQKSQKEIYQSQYKIVVDNFNLYQAEAQKFFEKLINDHKTELTAYQLTVENLRNGFDIDKPEEVKDCETPKVSRKSKSKKN
jgi:hypothetical protein